MGDLFLVKVSIPRGIIFLYVHNRNEKYVIFCLIQM